MLSKLVFCKTQKTYQIRQKRYANLFDKPFDVDTISSIKIINNITYVCVLKPYGSFAIYYELFGTCDNDIECIKRIGAKVWDEDIIQEFDESKILVYHGQYWL